MNEQYLELKAKEFAKAPRNDFRGYLNKSTGRSFWRAKTNVLIVTGVYGVYENSGRLLWIGKAGGGDHPLYARIGDMFCDTPTGKPHHQITKWLLNQKDLYPDLKSAHQFYFENCHFTYVETETEDKALSLESKLIKSLNPLINKQGK